LPADLAACLEASGMSVGDARLPAGVGAEVEAA
jgi:hypothetical protein